MVSVQITLNVKKSETESVCLCSMTATVLLE